MGGCTYPSSLESPRQESNGMQIPYELSVI